MLDKIRERPRRYPVAYAQVHRALPRNVSGGIDLFAIVAASQQSESGDKV